MRELKAVITEALSGDQNRKSVHNKIAKDRYEHFKALASTIGAYSGTHMKHTGVLGAGVTMYGTHPAHGSSKHEYAFRSDPLNRGDEGAYYGHVKFREGTSKEGLHEQILKQNPHLADTGHPWSFARNIEELHARTKYPIRSREDPHYDGHE